MTAIVPSRARERAVAIAVAMLSGRWERGKTARELAAELGCKVSTVESDACAIAHVVDHILQDRERLELALRARIDAIVQRFEAADEPERASVALAGMRDIARNAGIGIAKQETNVQVNVGAMPEDDAFRRLVRVLERPDPVTARALAAAGWTRQAPIEAQGDEA